MASSKDDANHQAEKDDVNSASIEDGSPSTFRETDRNASNGTTNLHSKHANRSHSTRDRGHDGKEKAHESERRKQSSSSSLVRPVSKGSRVYKTKYFIIKSLNHHNIEKSFENGIWATQAMNEPVLNEAFETADRVLLVFSVNMSGHFQGYAQMTSPIGRRRATVWSEANQGANPWGGSFSVEWLRLYDLPFQKTVHLKNPLNYFKPVKISRDCQELAEEVGQALCALIDEGADREERPKRKVTAGDLSDSSLKRRRKGSPGFPDGSQPRQQFSGRRNEGEGFPAAHSSRVPQGVNHEPLSSGQRSRMSRGFSIEAASYPFDPHRGSKSKSPHPVSSERSFDHEQDNEREKRPRQERRPLERDIIRDRTRSRSRGRSADLPIEEDLLNMTYEDYLQRHGHSRDFSNGYQQGPGPFFHNSLNPGYGPSWRGRNAGMGFPEDQYSDYVTNWYSRQGPPMGRDAFFDTGGIGNNYPALRPPDAR
ncbi:unnamed protein product [Calypogeia fissa]